MLFSKPEIAYFSDLWPKIDFLALRQIPKPGEWSRVELALLNHATQKFCNPMQIFLPPHIICAISCLICRCPADVLSKLVEVIPSAPINSSFIFFFKFNSLGIFFAIFLMQFFFLNFKSKYHTSTGRLVQNCSQKSIVQPHWISLIKKPCPIPSPKSVNASVL